MVDDKLTELEQKHGKGRVIDYTIDGVDVFFAIPTQADHERFVELSTDDNANKSVATREYVLASLAEPERRSEIAGLFERWPAVPNEIAKDLHRAAKGGMQRRAKK